MSETSLPDFMSALMVLGPASTLIPGLNDSTNGGFAGPSAIDTSSTLKRQAVLFAQAYHSQTISHRSVQDLAASIEGSIRAEQTLGIMNESQAITLIGQLHSLVDARNKPMN